MMSFSLSDEDEPGILLDRRRASGSVSLDASASGSVSTVDETPPNNRKINRRRTNNRQNKRRRTNNRKNKRMLTKRSKSAPALSTDFNLLPTACVTATHRFEDTTDSDVEDQYFSSVDCFRPNEADSHEAAVEQARWLWRRELEKHLTFAFSTDFEQTIREKFDNKVIPGTYPFEEVQSQIRLERTTCRASQIFKRYICIPLLKFLNILVIIFNKVFYTRVEQERVKSEHKYSHTKRILIGPTDGLMWYQAGLTAVIVENYGHVLENDVCFDGISGGCLSACLLAFTTHGLGTVTQYVGRAIDVMLLSLTAKTDHRYGLYANLRMCVQQIYFIAMNNILMSDVFECSSLPAQDIIDFTLKDRLVFWTTGFFPIQSIARAAFENVEDFADAFVCSCYNPKITSFAPSFVRRRRPEAGFNSIDGMYAPSCGDYTLFNPVHKEGRQIRTLYIETFPSSNAPADQDPNTRTLKLWQWGTFDLSNLSSFEDPMTATDMYLKGYHDSNIHLEELHAAIVWLFDDDAL